LIRQLARHEAAGPETGGFFVSVGNCEMLTFAKAGRLAETFVDLKTDGQGELVRESTIAKPYGWIFFYQNREYLRDPTNILNAYGGNAPFIVDRDTLEIRVFGTAWDVEHYIREYEVTMPPPRLSMKPELPSWSD
jgi:hypothetical protein